MLPVKMEITNFKGLRGRRTIEFARSFMTYCLPNAAGKTSLFDAFRWGLTGLEPEGEMVTKGEPGCRVDLFWEDGTITSRRRSMKTGTTNCYINGARNSMRDLNTFIAGLVGVGTDSLRICTSQDVLASLSPDKFSEFILGLIRIPLTAKQVAADAGADPRMQEIIEKYFADSSFGMKELDEFLAYCQEKRSAWRKRMQDAKASLHLLETLKKPTRNMEAILEEKRALEEQLEAFHKWDADMRAFLKAQAEARKCSDLIRTYTDKIKSIKATEPVAGRAEELLKKKKELEKEIREENGKIAEAEAETVSRKKELRRLTSEHCVASARILCTTDRSCAKKDIEQEIQNLQAEKEKAEKRRASLEEERVQIEKDMDADREDEVSWNRKKDLEEQAALLAEVHVTVPKEPTAVSDPRDALRRCEEETLSCREWMRASLRAEGAAEAEDEFTAYDRLIKTCGPKGSVREAILVRFLGTLAEAGNQKAEMIRAGMKISFITGKGIVPVLDPDGSGHFLRYEDLSGGQRVTLLYLLMDLIRQMTGINILMLDEAGVLDDETLGTLLLLLASSTEYDLIMLATAYHRSTAEIIESFGLELLEIPEA